MTAGWACSTAKTGDHGSVRVPSSVDESNLIRSDFAPGERLAYGSAADAEGMIQRDERGGLGHSVALNEREA